MRAAQGTLQDWKCFPLYVSCVQMQHVDSSKTGRQHVRVCCEHERKKYQARWEAAPAQTSSGYVWSPFSRMKMFPDFSSCARDPVFFNRALVARFWEWFPLHRCHPPGNCPRFFILWIFPQTQWKGVLGHFPEFSANIFGVLNRNASVETWKTAGQDNGIFHWQFFLLSESFFHDKLKVHKCAAPGTPAGRLGIWPVKKQLINRLVK